MAKSKAPMVHVDQPMDPAKTAPFTLGSGPRACLLLHGFTGSPWDMRPLGEALAAGGYRVSALCLPGHGATPRAMEQVTGSDWERAAEQALLALGGDEPVFLAGLSMGALLCALLGARFPERVRGIALLAPAMRFRGPSMWLARKMRRAPLLPLLHPWVEKTGTDLEDPVERAQAPVLTAFPTARLNDLWRLQDRARACLRKVRAPCLVVSARQDHVVAAGGARALARGLSGALRVEQVELPCGFHILPRDRDRERLFQEVLTFFGRVA